MQFAYSSSSKSIIQLEKNMDELIDFGLTSRLPFYWLLEGMDNLSPAFLAISALV